VEGQRSSYPGYEIECITPVSCNDDHDHAALAPGDHQPCCAGDVDLSGLDVLSRVASSQLHQPCSVAPDGSRRLSPPVNPSPSPTAEPNASAAAGPRFSPVDPNPNRSRSPAAASSDGPRLSPDSSRSRDSSTGTVASRPRFSILDLPLSQFIAAAAADTPADAADSDADGGVSAGYNVPCVGVGVGGGGGDGVGPALTSESVSRVIQQHQHNSAAAAAAAETSSEQRTGDVFTALRVDVGQYSASLVN